MVKKLINKYKDIIPYAFFGVLTTLVNIVTYWLCAHPMSLPVLPSTIAAWIAAVLFAYVTNRKWVFHSEAHGRDEIIKEMISFFACRFGTGIVDLACMFIFVKLIGFDDVVIKSLTNVLVIILNYIASKLIIFKHKAF